MSTIFNLFGAINVTPRGHQKAGSTDATFSVKTNAMESAVGPLKPGSTPKPRGLSIRPKNDLNLSTTSQKSSGLVKGKSVSKVVGEKPLRSISPRSKSPFFNLTMKQKEADDLLFKKPMTPKSTQRTRPVYPEPESIPMYMDDNYWCKYDLDGDLNALKEILKSKSVVPFTDEGFESDPELIPTPPMSPVKWKRCITPISDVDLEGPDMPILSDSDDDF